MNQEIQIGTVVAIKEKTNDKGTRAVVADVQVFGDFSIIPDVILDTPLYAQYVPVVGQIVLIQRTHNFFTKMIAYFATRPFDAPISSGETLMEGGGGGFVYLNNGGDVEVSDETLSNVIRVLNTIGITITANALSINVKGIGQFNITPENAELKTQNKIEFIKFDDTQRQVAKLTITNEKIAIDGPKVEVGLQENPIEAGTVISTSPIYGTYSVDIMTGRPIPRAKNSTVKISPTDHTQLT